MQFAKELVSAALQKGEQALSQLPVLVQNTTGKPLPTSVPMRQRSSSDGGSTSPPEARATSLAKPAPSQEVRVHRFQQELRASCINVDALKRLAIHGIPNKDGLRAVVWKVLLGYLPRSPEEWPTSLARRRTQYHVFCNELIVDPKRPMQQDVGLHSAPQPDAEPLAQVPTSPSISHPPLLDRTASSPNPLSPNEPHLRATRSQTGIPELPSSHQGGLLHEGGESSVSDHPLCLDEGSKWHEFFQDNEMLEQITRDVMRTHPDMPFFTGETEEAELHRQELRRALFMYAKLNPGLRYIQGMNELIAPLYYLFKQDKDPHERQYAEADAFWCFLELISEFRDHFCAQLDNAQTGIKATIRRLMHVLQHYDYDLWKHIEKDNKVDPQYYAFRWITLLLSQEFAFPDTLRIWDLILGDPHGRMDCLLRICTAMILTIKPRLMQGDFTVILKTLQRFPATDIEALLQRAETMPACEEVLNH